MPSQLACKRFLEKLLDIRVMDLMQKLRFGRLVNDHLSFTSY